MKIVTNRRTLTARRTEGKCPGCEQPIRKGDDVIYEHVDWPWNRTPGNGLLRADRDQRTRTEWLWHTACVTTALNDALCPSCRSLHPRSRSCT